MNPELTAIQNLIEVVAKLRDPNGGCPWDLAQTTESLSPYIIEEAYEVTAAIRSGEVRAIAEELGDLLLQVILQAQIAKEKGDFTLIEIANGITEKLIRRHPHVFGTTSVNNIDEVRSNWEQIKAQEKGEISANLTTKLKRYAETLPPMVAAMKISQQAAKVGFEWDNIAGVWEKFEEELREFKQALEDEPLANQEAELGDLLFVIIQLARWNKLDPSAALSQTNHKFITRLTKLEALSDRPLTDYSLFELEELWQLAKTQVG